MKQQILLVATLTLALSSISFAHSGGHGAAEEPHYAPGDERGPLMEEVGEVSELTDVSELEVRDGLAWLPGAKEPYSGWIIRKGSDHPKRTVLVKFKNGAPTDCRELTKHYKLLSLIEVMTDNQKPETTVGHFLERLIGDNVMWRPIGIQHGRTISWSPSGQRSLECNMLKGSWHGPYTFWSGDQVRDQGQYVMGKKDGVNVSFYNNGRKRSEELWDNGKPVTVQVWKIDGEKCPETMLNAGTGKHVWYHYNRGERWQEVSYVDGLKHGAETTYRNGGNELWNVEPWVKGQRKGTSIHYKFDGSRMETTFGGKQDGMRVHYNQDGSIRNKFATLADYQQHLTEETEKKYGK